jgi:hypothetical protein
MSPLEGSGWDESPLRGWRWWAYTQFGVACGMSDTEILAQQAARDALVILKARERQP